MKKCPFCAEEIQDAAIKCRFCGEFLDRPAPAKTRWYFSTTVVVIALLCVGPLALPLVWLHPRYKPITKLLVTLIVIALTVACYLLTLQLYQQVTRQLETLGI